MTGVARRTKSRFASRPLNDQSASMPPFNHPALTEGRTLYPATVRASRDRWALKSGDNARKIGARILKGRWRGYAVYTLTLEERKTCPTSCHHWRSCMRTDKSVWRMSGNRPCNLLWRLEREVALLEIRHPGGFAVRLHVLGDFFSVEYVQFWERLLERHPVLHVWGYSARHDMHDPIAAALAALVEKQWSRFAVRFSNAPASFALPATTTVEHPLQVPTGSVLCPEQTGKTESCSTRTRRRLCWATTRSASSHSPQH